MSQKSYDENSKLFLVPTPIGNLEDITLRALNTIKECDVIFSEDTRETIKLLNFYKINKKLYPYHKYNEDVAYNKILNYLKEGKNVALVSDRGTPSISDPGYVCAYHASSEGFNVICLPGATAFVPALVVSGINPNNFMFYGFLDNKKGKKKNELENLKDIEATLIFYESPFRIKETLAIMLEVFGNRNISISREISKKHEEVYRGTIEEVQEELENPKGEFVLVVEGHKHEIIKHDDSFYIKEINKLIKNGLSEMNSIKEVAKRNNVKKNEIYKIYHGGKK